MKSSVLQLFTGFIAGCAAMTAQANVKEEKKAAPEIEAQEIGPKAPETEVKQEPSITLAEAQKLATQFNPKLRNIEEVIYQADKMIQKAWSRLAPNLTANASITRNQNEITMGIPDFSEFDITDPTAELETEEIVIQELWDKNFGFSINMKLLNPRSIPGIKMAYNHADQTRLQAQVQKNNLLFAVTSTYYQVHSLKKMILAAEENLAMAEQFLMHSETRKKLGQATRIDVLRAELQVMDAKKELANWEDAKIAAKTALAYLIGVRGEFFIAEPDPIVEVEKSLDALTEHALAKRVELKEAEIAQRFSEWRRTESLMQWLPVFDVTYLWNWNSAAGFSGEKDSWMIIFGATWNLFEGGGRIADFQTRKSEIRMAQNNIEQAALDIREEVDKGHQDVRKKRRNVETAKKQVELAEENHHLVTRQYEVGLVSSLDVLDASRELAAKRQAHVREHLEYEISILSLKKAIGEYYSLALVPSR
ncbi:MAG: TolC family protein [Proteobacteria bacterium]|nr:TolC family protein [Pseudomonadota bacterium]